MIIKNATLINSKVGKILQSPVLWVDAGNTDSYSGTGNIWYDLSTTHTNVLLADFFGGSPPQWSSDFGGYFTFGDYQYGELENTANNVNFEFGTNDYTWELILWQENTSGYQTYFGLWTNTSAPAIGIRQHNGVFDWLIYTSEYIALSPPITTTVPLQEWFHLVCTRSGTEHKIYLNGQLVYTGYSNSVYSSPIPVENWYLASTEGQYDNFHGSMSLARIYKNVALNSYQVLQNFNQYSQRYGLSPVLWLDAGNTNSYPGTGNTWYDLSSNNYNGEFNSTPTYSSSDSGYLTVNGQYADFGNQSAFDFGSNDFTVNFWINPAQWEYTGSVGIIGKKSYDGTNGWQVYHNNSHDRTNMVARLTQDNDFPSASNVQVGVWQNWTMVRSGSTFSWYLNGVLDNTAACTYSINDPTANLYVCYAQTWGGAFNGSISIVQIYNYALNADTIAGSFNQYRSRYGV